MARLRGPIRVGRLESHGLEELNAGFCFQSKLGRQRLVFIREDFTPDVENDRRSSVAAALWAA
jgi:hypothetical protein